jgi:hypothetical protein
MSAVPRGFIIVVAVAFALNVFSSSAFYIYIKFTGADICDFAKEFSIVFNRCHDAHRSNSQLEFLYAGSLVSHFVLTPLLCGYMIVSQFVMKKQIIKRPDIPIILFSFAFGSCIFYINIFMPISVSNNTRFYYLFTSYFQIIYNSLSLVAADFLLSVSSVGLVYVLMGKKNDR